MIVHPKQSPRFLPPLVSFLLATPAPAADSLILLPTRISLAGPAGRPFPLVDFGTQPIKELFV